MKRIILTALGLLAVTAAGMTGLAYWVGIQIETQYRIYLERNATASNLNPTSVHYRRGWFASDATTGLRMAKDGGIQVFLRHRIHHGLLPMNWWVERGDFSLRPVQAIVRTVLDGEAAWLGRLKMLYQGREPLVIISRIHLDGSSSHGLLMPPLDIADPAGLSTVAFSGLQGQFQATPPGDVTRAGIDVAALRIADGAGMAGAVRLRNLSFDLDQRRGRFHFMVGNSILQLDELGLDHIDAVAASILLSGIRLLGKTTERETAIDGELELAVESVAVNDKALGQGQLQLSLTGLDGVLLRQIQQWSQHQILDRTDGRTDEMLPLFQGLLARHPTLNLKTRVDALQGTLQFVAEVVFQEFSQIRLRDPRTLLQTLARATVEISISKALLEDILRNFLKAQLRSMALAQEQAIDEQALDRYAVVRIQRQLAQWLDARFIEVTGDRYRTRGRYADGRLLINGMRIPLWF